MSSSSFTERVDAAYEKYKDADVDVLMRAIGAEDPDTDPHPLAVWALQQAGRLMRIHAAQQIASGKAEFEFKDMRVFVSTVLLMGVISGAMVEEDKDGDDEPIEAGVINRLVMQIATEEGQELSHEEMTADLATYGLDFETSLGQPNELVGFAVDRADRILHEMADNQAVGVVTQSTMASSMGAQFLAGVTMGVKAVFAWLDGDNPA